MRSPDSIKILLQVRCGKAEAEERKLVAIIKQIKFAEAELAGLSAELKRVASMRNEIQCLMPNTHHQAIETQSRALRQRYVEQAAEIEKLKDLRAQQMSAYTFAHREREVMERLDRERSDLFEVERRRVEQKLNEDLFLARRVAKWNTRSGEP